MTSPFLQLLGFALAEDDLRAVRDLVARSLRAEARTLELGCGPGLFADLFANGDYVGVDPRPRFIDYARRHRPGAFLCDELTAVGLPGARFDQALGLDLVGPRSEIAGRSVIVEARRLLAPAGRVLLIERAAMADRVARLAANLLRVERREPLKSGLRERVAIELAT